MELSTQMARHSREKDFVAEQIRVHECQWAKHRTIQQVGKAEVHELRVCLRTKAPAWRWASTFLVQGIMQTLVASSGSHRLLADVASIYTQALQLFSIR